MLEISRHAKNQSILFGIILNITFAHLTKFDYKDYLGFSQITFDLKHRRPFLNSNSMLSRDNFVVRLLEC